MDKVQFDKCALVKTNLNEIRLVASVSVAAVCAFD